MRSELRVSCINRRGRKAGGSCTSRHLPVASVERAVEDHYRTAELPEWIRTTIGEDVQRDADDRSAVIAKSIERHQRRIKTPTDNQARLVQLAYRGLVTDEVLSQEQIRLEGEKTQTEQHLTQQTPALLLWAGVYTSNL